MSQSLQLFWTRKTNPGRCPTTDLKPIPSWVIIVSVCHQVKYVTVIAFVETEMNYETDIRFQSSKSPIFSLSLSPSPSLPPPKLLNGSAFEVVTQLVK